MTNNSILEELTRLSTSVPAPATDLIVFLLRSIAQKASEGIRGTQTYYRIVSRARDICNCINDHIEDARNKMDGALLCASTSQIVPLEDILFEISKLVESEREALDMGLAPKSISECLDNIKSWMENQSICRHVVQKLHSPPFELPTYAWDSDFDEAAHFDGLSWISAIYESITKILAPLSPEIHTKTEKYTHISDTIKLLAEIQTSLELNADIEVTQEFTMVLSTRCFMVTHGVITVSNQPCVDKEVRAHLSSPRTWKMVSGLLEELNDLIKDSSASPYELFEKWNAFDEYLLNAEEGEGPSNHHNLTEESVDDVLEPLMQYPTKIQQFYLAQVLVLINLCRNIGAHVKVNHPYDGLNVVKNVVASTSKALDVCLSEADGGYKFNWDELRATPASHGIESAVNHMRVVYEQLSMKLEDIDTSISSALETDKAYFDSLQKYRSSLVNGHNADSGTLQDIPHTDSEAIHQRFSKTMGFRPNPSPATARIAFLVQSISEQIVRRSQSSNSVLNKARDACKQMDELILNAEQSKDWSIYIRSTMMMQHMELNLLHVLQVVTNRVKQLEFTVQQKAIKTCLESLDSWKQGCNAVKDLLAVISSENWLECIDYLITPNITVANLTGQWEKIDIVPSAAGGQSDVFKAKLVTGHPDMEQLIAVKVLRVIRIPQNSPFLEILKRVRAYLVHKFTAC
ncbi:hypothetical protein FRC02_001452 [Tulasnella sp. 418]|nr:hypothetical protein FRC02_001452 [Tulasnella sp. 418]